MVLEFSPRLRLLTVSLGILDEELHFVQLMATRTKFLCLNPPPEPADGFILGEHKGLHLQIRVFLSFLELFSSPLSYECTLAVKHAHTIACSILFLNY